MTEDVLARHALHLVVHVRGCTRDDLPALEWWGLYGAHRGIIEEAWNAHESGSNVMLVADLRGAPVGQVWIDFTRKADERAAVIWALRVHPILQNLGLGARLLATAETLARDRGFDVAEVAVEKASAGLVRLFERSGYTAFGEETSPSANAGDAERWLLRKTIAPAREDGFHAGARDVDA